MLPKKFKPSHIPSSKLIRLGSIDDGGYVVPKAIFQDIKRLISFGISDNWDFEKDLVLKAKCGVDAYDYSINLNFWIKRFMDDLLKFLQLKIFKPKKIYKMFKLLDFFYFFYIKKDNNFFLKKIGKNKNETSFNKTVSKYKDDIFLKIDIEGSEYELLPDLIKFSNKNLIGIVIEFHHISSNLKKIINFIDKIKKNLALVHIHGNNYSVKSAKLDPEAIEMTFVNVKYLSKKNTKNSKKYPIKNLDFPNSKRSKDILMRFK